MKKKMGFFEQFYLAVAKHTHYIVLTKLPGKQQAIYFLGITFLLALIAYIVPMAGFLASIGGYETFFREKLPAFAIEDGTLSIETEDENSLDFTLNQIHVVADVTVERYTEQDVTDLEEYAVLFSKSNVATNVSGIPMVFGYDIFGDELLDNEKLASMSGQFYGMVAFAGILAWLSQMCSYAFLALLFAVCGMGINRISGVNLPFRKLYCIALYAETMFALASHLVNYFFSGILAFIIYFVSAMISMRAVNTGILLYKVLPKSK